MQEIIKKTIIARLAFDNTLYNIKNWAYLCRYKSLTTFHVFSSYHPYAVFLPPSSWSEVVTVSFVFLINPFYIYYFSINKTTFYFSLMVSDSLYQRNHKYYFELFITMSYKIESSASVEAVVCSGRK